MTNLKILEYFLNPLAEGYTLEKTIVLALIAIASTYLIYKALQKLKIRVDSKLAISVTPFVLFGSALRVLNDMGLLTSILFVTPNIYLLVFSIFFSVLLASKLLLKQQYYKLCFLIGFLLFSTTISLVELKNFRAIAIDFIIFLPFLLFFKKISWKAENKLVALLQIFDGTTSYSAINFFGYEEQHFLPSLLIAYFAPQAFILLKILAVIFALLYLDKHVKNKNERNYIKLLIGVLALATSTRDLLRVAALA